MSQRNNNLEKIRSQKFDVLVIGGGINGAVSAASLAARGASVALVEANDFASGVSSQSSNLAWGGIKYLESFEFGLVRKLCTSRNRLARRFPSAVRELRFLTVVPRGFRWPASVVYLGAVLYWLMGNCQTRAPRYLSKVQMARREPCLAGSIERREVRAGFEYSDCYFEDNDSRFVFNMVRTALRHGAVAANYLSAQRFSHSDESGWCVGVRDEIDGTEFEVNARVVINAAGPWADELNDVAGVTTQHKHLFSKGAHLIVKRITDGRRVLTLFASDGRPFFVIPMGTMTCIGTTDTRVADPEVGISEEDRTFILDNVNAGLGLAEPLTRDDIIAERCGVRPLAVQGSEGGDDWLQLSRKHAIDIDSERKHISIFGGKLTDCVNVGESIADEVATLDRPLDSAPDNWCGEPSERDWEEFMAKADAAGLNVSVAGAEPLGARLWRRYGLDAHALLQKIEQDPAQAEPVLESAELVLCELDHARDREMVVTLDDFLRRRTRMSLQARRSELLADPGLNIICQALFGDDAQRQLAAYIALGDADTVAATDGLAKAV